MILLAGTVGEFFLCVYKHFLLAGLVIIFLYFFLHCWEEMYDPVMGVYVM